jgi:serine/threonine protein kinase
MKRKLYNKELGYISIPSRDAEYLASGGEASIYTTSDKKNCLKLYHDPLKSIKEEKCEELSTLKHKNIITPKGLLYESSFVGYYMSYLHGLYNLREIFPKSFKIKNGLDVSKRKNIVEKLIDIVDVVHNHGFLIVDLNADNVLISKKFDEAYLIDTDSYKTFKFPATAIQDAIKDRLVKDNKFSKESDWFSFACLAFQVYVGIHPYAGIHKDYQGDISGVPALTRRMDNNISVFDSEVKLARSVDDFNTIPKNHLEWFKYIFEKNGRSRPKKVGENFAVKNPTNYIIVKSSDKLELTELFSFGSIIREVKSINGRKIFVTDDGLFNDNQRLSDNPNDIVSTDQTGDIIILKNESNKLSLKELELEYEKLFVGSRGIYRLLENKIYYDEIRNFNKTFAATKLLSEVGSFCKIGDNCGFENLLNTGRLISFSGGNSFQVFLPNEIKDYQIVNCKIVNSKFALMFLKYKGKYYSSLLDLESKKFLKKKDSSLDINMVGLKNGLVVKSEQDRISIFSSLDRIKVVEKTGLDDSCRLFSNGDSIFMHTENKFYKLKLK